MRLRYSFTVTLLIVLFSTISLCQTVDEMAKTVVYLSNKTKKMERIDGKIVEIWKKDPINGRLEPIYDNKTGTGFIIKHNNRDYLVTAKHAADFLDSTAVIILNNLNNEKITIKFQLLSRALIIKNAKWFKHPQADIAIHAMAYPEKVDALAVRTTDISKEDRELKLLSNVYILGFPFGLGLHNNISPIAKQAQIASNITSINNSNLNPNLKFYLLDQAIAQGYSGSPVYYAEETSSGVYIGDRAIAVGEAISIIGIISGSLSDATGGKISLVVPISYLWDIINSDEFIKYERGLE